MPNEYDFAADGQARLQVMDELSRWEGMHLEFTLVVWADGDGGAGAGGRSGAGNPSDFSPPPQLIAFDYHRQAKGLRPVLV